MYHEAYQGLYIKQIALCYTAPMREHTEKPLANVYNETYRTKGEGFRGGKPMKVVEQIPELLRGGQYLILVVVLDAIHCI